MTYTHAIVWLDHTEAHVIHLDEDTHRAAHVRSPHGKEHLHHRSGTVASGHTATHADFLAKIRQAIEGTPEILLVGPAQAKLDLKKYLEKQAPKIAGNVLGVETVDHPSEGQLVQFARKFFRAADRMRPREG